MESAESKKSKEHSMDALKLRTVLGIKIRGEVGVVPPITWRMTGSSIVQQAVAPALRELVGMWEPSQTPFAVLSCMAWISATELGGK